MAPIWHPGAETLIRPKTLNFCPIRPILPTLPILPICAIDGLLNLVEIAPALCSGMALTLCDRDSHMPKVGSTHYPYTAAGKKAAAAARKAGKGKSKPKPKRK